MADRVYGAGGCRSALPDGLPVSDASLVEPLASGGMLEGLVGLRRPGAIAGGRRRQCRAADGGGRRAMGLQVDLEARHEHLPAHGGASTSGARTPQGRYEW